eukprot:7386900-Prymnesium_polylepis.3
MVEMRESAVARNRRVRVGARWTGLHLYHYQYHVHNASTMQHAHRSPGPVTFVCGTWALTPRVAACMARLHLPLALPRAVRRPGPPGRGWISHSDRLSKTRLNRNRSGRRF